jgi:glycosyltransferase involved in cell wall biosynthesis
VPTLAVIVNTCNQADYLGRVLAAVAAQSQPADEVIVADDGSGEDTRTMFARWRRAQSLRCEHVWQEHAGFRRARILNLAIAQARAEYLVFLDGDTVPHPRFLADHRLLSAPGQFVQGHRALVGKEAAKWFGARDFADDRRRAILRWQLSGLKHAFRWPVALKTRRTDLDGIRGCNLGIWRADLVRVNGYNEEFTGWGREDSELAVRLMNSGVRRLDVRGRACCFHLWHPAASRSGLGDNDSRLAAAITAHATRCEQGLDQHRPAATA